MLHVLVLAEDECVRLTCAEVLTRLGLEATAGDWPRGLVASLPDVVLIWEPTEPHLGQLRAELRGVPFLVCTWRYREPWPESVRIVRLPFNGDRVARIVEQTVRETRRPGAQSSR